MDRRSFMLTLGTAAVLPFIPKAVAAACEKAGVMLPEGLMIKPGFIHGRPVEHWFCSSTAAFLYAVHSPTEGRPTRMVYPLVSGVIRDPVRISEPNLTVMWHRVPMPGYAFQSSGDAP